MQKRIFQGKVDSEGRLVLPPEILHRFGLAPGASFQIQASDHQLSVSSPLTHLQRVYVEATTLCNLSCRTCMRNVWNEPVGMMDQETYQNILEGLQSFSPVPGIFFGGFGEPFAHPNLQSMVTCAREREIDVELITNGILLDERAAEWIVESGVSRVWVSIDGASPESYTDVRLGDAFPGVVENLARLQEIRARRGAREPKLGIAFVAMQRNLADLPAVVRLAQRLGADRVSVSNVLAHTPELWKQALYSHAMSATELQPTGWPLTVSFPRIDLDAQVLARLADVINAGCSLELGRQPVNLGVNSCPFLEKGSLSIRWDGMVSPCLPLLHTHTGFLEKTQRISNSFGIGNLHERSLFDLWNDPAYTRLRTKLQDFDFSACTFCNSCEMAETNLQDCFGNSQPACGGCLWAQGFIQCP